MTTKNSNKETDNDAVKSAVSKSLPALTAAALSSAIGSMYVLKLSVTDTGRMKYVPVEGTEEIIQAIDWIAEHGNNFTTNGNEGFFIIQQRPPDSKFWDALVNRHLGKVPEEQRVEMSHKIDLTKLGQRAAEYTVHNQKQLTEPIPTSWL